MTSIEKKHLFISASCLLLTSIFSTGYYHFDEHFQILEFTGLKLGLTQTDELPWEFHEQIRSGLAPAIVYFLGILSRPFGPLNPFSLAIFTRILSAVFSFYLLVKTYQTLKPKITEEHAQKLFLHFSFLSWFIIYLGVRFSAENWSAICFTLGTLPLLRHQKKHTLHYFSSGMLFGVAFLLRYQIGFIILVLLLWLYIMNKQGIKQLVTMVTGILLVVMIGLLIDFWYYQEWTVTAWNYLQQFNNPAHNNKFSNDPWWYYFVKFFNQVTPPLSLLIFTGIVSYFFHQRKSLITWIMLPFILLHFFIGHKELRFLFPLMYFLPFVFISGLSSLKTHTNAYKIAQSRAYQWLIKLGVVGNVCFLLIVLFRPSNQDISLYQKIYTQYPDGAILYHLDDNPYQRVWLNINFYKRQGLKIKKISSLNEIPSNKTAPQLIAFKTKKTPPNFDSSKKLIYSSFPPWMKHLNFNNWQSRTKSWLVYEL